MIDLETIGEVADAGSALIGMGDDYNLVAAVYEFGGQLVNVTFDSARLGEEEVTDHGNIVRHLDLVVPASRLLAAANSDSVL